MTNVDRRSPLPLYAQLEQALLGRIRDDNLAPGDRLPTEAQIAASYAVSRTTIRQALDRLVSEGYVERIQGLGSFVAKPRPRHQPLLTSFTENMQAQGYEPRRQVLRSELQQAPGDAIALFDTDGRCQYVQRLLLADERPVGLSETWLPTDALAGRLDLFHPVQLEGASLYDLLEGPQIGLQLHRGTETIQAGTATAEQAQLLECPLGGPTLIVRRVTYTASERPVEYTLMTFVADRYEYRVELFRPSD